MTVVDASHVHDSYGVPPHKVAGSADPRYALGLPLAQQAKPYLREEPFDLNGS